MSSFSHELARVHLVNIETGQSVGCLLNPKGFTEKIQPNYIRQCVPGLSHRPLQYQFTNNREITDLEFYLNKLYAKEQPGDGNILRFQTFLRALAVPTKSPAPCAPPRTLFVWPKVITLKGIITELSFSYQQFAADGSLLAYTAKVALEEIP